MRIRDGHTQKSTFRPTYNSWRGMRNRCNQENNSRFKDYGGRGIKHCLRWNSFHSFIEDMGLRPPGLTLDRIDNDKGYYKENCRWVSNSIQLESRRTESNSGEKHIYVRRKSFLVDFNTPYGRYRKLFTSMKSAKRARNQLIKEKKEFRKQTSKEK